MGGAQQLKWFGSATAVIGTLLVVAATAELLQSTAPLVATIGDAGQAR